LLKNPYKFKVGIKKEQTPSMLVGSAIHCMVLEPHLFDEDYIVAPVYDARTTAGKAIKAEFEAQAVGKTILQETQYQTARNCADAILNGGTAEFFKNGVAEQPFFSVIDGVAVKCKPDYYIESMGIVVDIKKTTDASPKGFAKACLDYGYHISAAHYLSVLRSLGKRANQFVLVCVEDTAPHMTAVYEFGQEELELGQKKVEEALALYKRLGEFDKPVYRDLEDTTKLVQTIKMPKWAFN
jgi:exodeoxyribonuclease VIII